MVIDSLRASDKYTVLNRFFAMAFEYIKQCDLQNIEPGRYEIEDGSAFMMVSYNDLRPAAEAPLEAHNEYIDIQLILQGSETFGWADRSGCSSPRGKIDLEKDILFFDDEPTTYFTLNPGEFAVFFPGDAHAPLVGEGRVKKCVIKVRV